ncbi:MAG TPA: signal peptidase I [Gaiellaceae bacterium]
MVGAAFLIVVGLIATNVLRISTIRTSAMEPTLHCGKPGAGCLGSEDDRIAVLSFVFSSPKRGDIVAFRMPPKAARACGAGGVSVKRIVAVPGETWSERNGIVTIDGVKLHEPYVKAAERDHASYPRRKLGPGRFFVMGDNRAGSCDSRRFGTVPRGSLLGTVVATYWPPSRISLR